MNGVRNLLIETVPALKTGETEASTLIFRVEVTRSPSRWVMKLLKTTERWQATVVLK